LRLESGPVGEDPGRARALGARDVPDDHVADEPDLLGLREPLEIDHAEVTAPSEVAGPVEHVGDPAAHAGGEVPARGPEHDHPAPRHVLAAVVPDPLDDRPGAAVADGEALARETADVGLAARRAVERDVADDDVVLRHERRGTGPEDA